MPDKRPRVVMLCRPGFSARVMYNTLRDQFAIERVIMERKPALSQTLRRKLNSLGLLRTVGQLLFLLFSKLQAKLSRRRREQLVAHYVLDESDIPDHLLQSEQSINSDSVITTLRELNPDAVVVNGTRIISAEVLSAIEAPFLNTHMGITPRYRGVHGGYWALVNNDRENCGVTVHLVDTGIDTGGVLYQQAIDSRREDNFSTYPIHQLAAALPLMRAALKDVVHQRVIVKTGVPPSQLWYHPTLLAYLRNRLLHGVR